MKQYTIGIDARLCGSQHAGLGRYIKNLVLRLPFVLPANYQLVYFFADKTQWSEVLQDLSSLDLSSNCAAAAIFARIKIVIAPVRHYSLAEQWQMPKLFAAQKLDLLHVPHFNAPVFTHCPKLVLTIHDLLWHQKKGLQMTTLSAWQYHLKHFFYLLVVKMAVKKAVLIITPSKISQKAINYFYPTVKNKVKVIYNGAADFSHLKAKKPLLNLPHQYLLYVGSLYPHKNVDLLLQALRAQTSLNLVIVSARDAFWKKLKKQISQYQLSDRVYFLGKVSDEQLKYLYQHTQALVQPSLSEGFGLTGIEALSLGTKVLASQIPIFSEIYGQAYFAFDPLSVDSFLQAFALSQKTNDIAFSKKAQQQASHYDWQQFAKQIATYYQQILS